MSDADRSKQVIETVADGLRLQVGDLPGDYAPTLLKAPSGAYVVGFTAGVSRAMDVSVGNATVRILERACRQGLPQGGDLGQRLADVATGLLVGTDDLTDNPDLAALREDAEAEGRAFVEDNRPPSGLRDLVYDE
jgi:hypothetical protein